MTAFIAVFIVVAWQEYRLRRTTRLLVAAINGHSARLDTLHRKVRNLERNRQ